MEKCALGKFARPGCARAGMQTSFKNFRRHQCSAVATDLDQIFAGITRGRAMDSQHHLVDQSICSVENFPEMLHMRCKSRRLFFAAKHFVRDRSEEHTSELQS